MSASLLDRLRHGPPLVLDGAMGTELERRQVATPLPAWTAAALVAVPAAVLAIHREYVAAGADLLTTATFRSTRRALTPAGAGARAAELTVLAVRLAREAAAGAARPVHVLGSMAPLEDCYRPDLVPEPEALAAEHQEHARSLAGAGVDAILIETMNTRREATVAVAAAWETGLPVLASFVAAADGNLLDGEPLRTLVPALIAAGAAALLVNCTPVATTERVLPTLAVLAGSTPFGAYANLGYPHPGRWEFATDVSPADFARHATGWIRAGARIVGGCCGTTPAHIAAVRAAVDRLHPLDSTRSRKE